GHAPKGFGKRHLVGIIQPQATVFFRLGDAEQAQLAQPPEQFMGGKDALGFPRRHMRIDMLFDVSLGSAANLVVFVGKHGVLLVALEDQKRATPKLLDVSVRRRASRQTDSVSCSTRRVSRGSIRPSSNSRALP